MRYALLLMSGILLSCDSPSPNMARAERQDVQIDGYKFTVWRKEDRVEVIRHGFARPVDQPHLRELMAKAAQTVTDCPLHPQSIEGDTGVLRATLDCG